MAGTGCDIPLLTKRGGCGKMPYQLSIGARTVWPPYWRIGRAEMKLEEIVRRLSLEARTAAGKLDAEVTGGYASDLLSCVMAKAQEGNVWVTIQAHPNIVAVASLLDLAGVIIAEGVAPDPSTLEKAEEEGVPVLTTELTTYTVVGRLVELGVPGVESAHLGCSGELAGSGGYFR
jgi:hypothetical protein